jgi:hypothetical protein
MNNNLISWDDADKLFEDLMQSAQDVPDPISSKNEAVAVLRSRINNLILRKEAPILQEVINALYFDDSSKYKGSLYNIIEMFKPGYAPKRLSFLESTDDAYDLLKKE